MLSSIFSELFRVAVYKNGLGKIARRLTSIGLALVFCFGAYAFYSAKFLPTANINLLVSLILGFVGLWCAFRIVNVPVFAEFLISVEAEMTKVSWPTKRELFVTTKVVLAFMIMFIAVIYIYDNALIILLAKLNGLIQWLF